MSAAAAPGTAAGAAGPFRPIRPHNECRPAWRSRDARSRALRRENGRVGAPEWKPVAGSGGTTAKNTTSSSSGDGGMAVADEGLGIRWYRQGIQRGAGGVRARGELGFLLDLISHGVGFSLEPSWSRGGALGQLVSRGGRKGNAPMQAGSVEAHMLIQGELIFESGLRSFTDQLGLRRVQIRIESRDRDEGIGFRCKVHQVVRDFESRSGLSQG